jgi:CPA2 family monovalent cation:H+ antiporter-2
MPARARSASASDFDLAVIGADVTAVRRHGIRGAEPTPDMVLHAGDVLVLRGWQKRSNWPRNGCCSDEGHYRW